MRVLVADNDVAFATALSDILRDSLDVETAFDGAEAVAALRARAFDLVIAEWLLPSMDGISLVRAMREAGSSAPFVMCTVLAQREARDYALAAGVSEVLVKPTPADAVASAVLSRLVPGSAPVLVASAAAATPASSGVLRGAAPSDDDLSKFIAKGAWRDIGKTLARGLSAATGKTLHETAAPSAGEKHDTRTTLVMVDVRSRIRLELGIFTSIQAGRDLAKDVVGVRDPQADDVIELLAEMCNQTLGAVKTAMRAGGMHFTLFVPRTRFVQPASEWASQFPASRTVHLAGEAGLEMMLVLGARLCVVKTVDVALLRENMVLIDDVRDDSGALLAEAAARLTANMLVRIKMRAGRQRVSVAQ
ncbi:MAG TPA: response regulator [Polyangiaceae bacterium]|jgi:CheY-like chemotaxis protein|nr:response regulator [Polyangiaceae bacterium]